jgi:lyso-ornithine lipid O-acyltransferase
MRGSPARLLRRVFRMAAFTFHTVRALLQGLFLLGPKSWKKRGSWLQANALAYSRILNLNVQVYGEIPSNGLVVSNHLGYLDILVLGSIMPCTFISKKDVHSWPVLGWLASLGGTLFVDRDRRQDLPNSLKKICHALDRSMPLILFPEGTSSGGQQVLPFRSSLFEAVSSLHIQITPAALCYSLADGSVQEEICYWRDMTFLPHFWNLLGKKQPRAVIHFGAPVFPPAPRKILAGKLHHAVAKLHSL